MEYIKSFLVEMFRPRNIIQGLLWMILGPAITRAYLFALHIEVREVWYWVITPLAFLLLVAVITHLRRPQLVGEVDRLTAGTRSDTASTGILVGITVKNLGAPTSVHSWRVSLKLTGQQSLIELPILFVEGTARFSWSGGRFEELHGADQIMLKTVDPIERGRFIRGFLVCTAHQLSKDRVLTPGNELRIDFEDVWGRKYHVALPITTEGEPLHAPQFFPGFKYAAWGTEVERETNVDVENSQST